MAQSSTDSIVKDADGNVYHTIKLGNQVWTVENLRTTKFNDGSAIAHGFEAEWNYLGKEGNSKLTIVGSENKLISPGYCYYNEMTNSDSIIKFGALYNWYAVNTKKLAPKGWHVPNNAEWDTLREYLIANGYNWEKTTELGRIKVAKSLAAKTDWKSDTGLGTIGNDLSKNNKTGFSALPGGFRYYHGSFNNIGHMGCFWSATASDATHAYYRALFSDEGCLGTMKDYKRSGFSVRLLRNN